MANHNEDRLTDMERLLILNLATKAWVAIANDVEMRSPAAECISIISKLSGADKVVIVRSQR